MNKKKYIDMHIHSIHSDGNLSVEELIKLASVNNVGTLSITDHDSLGAYNNMSKNNLEIINGIEFSSYCFVNGKKIKVHILAYDYDISNNELLNLVYSYRDKRIFIHNEYKNILMNVYEKVSDEILNELSVEKYCWFDRIIIETLVKHNVPIEIIENIKKIYLANKFCYTNNVQEYEVDYKEVINIIKNANGLSVLAHPFEYNLSNSDIILLIKELKNQGLDGLEIFQSECSLEGNIFLQNIAKKLNLLESGGSDFHRHFTNDMRKLGLGINNNLCIDDITLLHKIRERKLK